MIPPLRPYGGKLQPSPFIRRNMLDPGLTDIPFRHIFREFALSGSFSMNNVQEKIKIHDRYQFEIKYTYPLNKELPETDYLVETFIFIPNNLGVNADSYT